AQHPILPFQLLFEVEFEFELLSLSRLSSIS
ncbi:hypothetical protein A2U01_0087657, partial [Trifolium medium]|nr:hypothetical protein [Trifolium medium]